MYALSSQGMGEVFEWDVLFKCYGFCIGNFLSFQTVHVLNYCSYQIDVYIYIYLQGFK